MPLFYQHNINESTKLAVWHITEPEDFFLEKVIWQNKVGHPHKRLQHLAWRFLLQLLHPDFPLHLISISDSKKPLLANEEFHFSISHCGDYAAAIVCENKVVGIDVEIVTPKIQLVKNKFLSEAEIQLLCTGNYQSSMVNHQMLTLFWSTKEAVFKWYGKGAVSFKNNIIIHRLFFEKGRGIIDAAFTKDERMELQIKFRFFDNLCLAWVVE